MFIDKATIILGTGFFFIIFLVLVSHLNLSFAHTSKTFGNTTIEVGWLSEPPLVADLNGITLQVSKGNDGQQTPVLNALSNLTLYVKFGTITKELEFDPSETTDGGYEGKIIPTRAGPYTLVLQGDVKGQKVDSEFKIEDVESKSLFSFPDNSIDTSNSDNIGQNIQNAISKISNDIDNNRNDLNMSQKEITDIQNSISRSQNTIDISYLISMTAVGMGMAGIVSGALSLSRGFIK